MIRTYSELIKHKTFLERFNYLKLSGVVGSPTFGSDRYLNQTFYHSAEWRSIRDQVIIRDGGCDLGIPGLEIEQGLVVHHINPVSGDDIVHGTSLLSDLENLICTSHKTHLAIHYGDKTLLSEPLVERKPGDTTLW